MDNKVKITGALDYKKLNDMSVEERNSFIKKDVEQIMENHITAHENDEEPHYYNKEDWYSIRAEYTIVDSYYNHQGAIKAFIAYNFNAGAKIKKVEHQSA